MRCAVAILRDRAVAVGLNTWGSTDADEEAMAFLAEDGRKVGIVSLGPFVPLGATAFVWDPFETEKASLTGEELERTPAAFSALGGVKMEFAVSLMVEETRDADDPAEIAGSGALAALLWAP